MSIEKILASIPGLDASKRLQMRENAVEQSEGPDPKKRDEAMRVLAGLDQHEFAQQSALIGELTALSNQDRVVRAFTVQPMTETEVKLVQVLLDHPASTSTQLSEHLGWGGMSWHLHFGTMCANRAIYLWPAPPAEHRNGKFYSGILADLKEPENLFTMKPEAADAFAVLGLRGVG
jgi:hypothetical protein